jgi:hypothetical protein
MVREGSESANRRFARTCESRVVSPNPPPSPISYDRSAAARKGEALDPVILVFDVFLVIHIVAGAVGLVTFWIPVIGRKGSDSHKKWGRIFSRCIMTAGICAIAMSLVSLGWPLETHPKLADAMMVRGLFGWMMLYLAILTVSLVWHGLKAVELKGAHGEHRRWFPVLLQIAVIVSALNCAIRGYLIDQPLMMGIAVIGLASAVTNLWFIFTPAPWRLQYLIEHFKALVGAGISVYTAFFAFGAVRLHPKSAFDPLLWATPCTVGLGIILWHFVKTMKLKRQQAARLRQRDAATSPSA